jgi:Protein of unknown function (DUF4232)
MYTGSAPAVGVASTAAAITDPARRTGRHRRGRTAVMLRTAAVMTLVAGTSLATTTIVSAAPAASTAACQTSHLKLSLGPAVSEQTGEHAVILRLTNTGKTCTLRGYPTVRIAHDGHALTFHHTHGGMYTGHQKATTVTVARQGHVFFEIAKYRCDVGPETSATNIGVTLPHAAGKLQLHLRPSDQGLVDRCAKGNTAQSYVLETSPLHAHATY